MSDRQQSPLPQSDVIKPNRKRKGRHQLLGTPAIHTLMILFLHYALNNHIFNRGNKIECTWKPL